MNLPSLSKIQQQLAEQGYISDDAITMSLHLSQMLQKPLLVEGPAGVGKTEIAKVLATLHDTELIRLQCYEGLDVNHSLYEWNYQKQLLYLKMSEQLQESIDQKEKQIFSDDFLLKRPLLKAITSQKRPVLLIDELDRADEEFESFLLELLSDWQITIPEIGTIKAQAIPQVVITSNRVRELSDALRRRCLYLWIDYPSLEKELEIIYHKVPDINKQLAQQIAKFMQEVRKLRLDKVPGTAETLDWARALASMHIDHLDKPLISQTLGLIIKDWQDTRHLQDSLSELWEKTGVSSKLN
ncbi:MAG: MoxR family ATPase [Cyclobacteriaceae bacterium]|nr:MoxR family ATPase [Cyclobacteriaceae bacterium]